MKKTGLAAAALLGLIVHAATAQNVFKVYPEKPVEGDSITLYYNPENTVLKGLAPVNGIIYLYRNDDWEAHDLRMNMTDSGWITRYLLPKGTSLLVSNFSANGKTDKGGRYPYASVVFKSNGSQMPTSYAAWAFLRTPVLKEYTPSAAADTAAITPEVSLFWMNNELRYIPESRRRIFYNAMTILKAANRARFDSVILREIAYISGLSDVTEKELMDISKAYRRLLGDSRRADSMDNLIIARYPDGITARDKDLLKINRSAPEVRAALWKEFVVKYPLHKFINVDTETNGLWYEKIYRGIVYQTMSKKEYGVMEAMIPDAPFLCLTEFHRLLVMGPYDHGEVTAEFIFPYSKMLVEQIEKKAQLKEGAESRFYSPLQWQQRLLNGCVPSFLGHAILLHKLGDDKTALMWMEKVNGVRGTQSAEFMGLYATLLENTGRHKEAMQIVENSVAMNRATPETIALLRKEYIKKHKSDAGFDAYFNSLKSAEQLSAQQEHLRSQLIRKNAPTFRLEQLKGGYADLSKLKGHIVVLDFWATWCGPCKAALPGMQMAVSKYAKDDKVDFFFIATQETKPDYREQIKSFLKANNYQLNVLYDSKNPKSGRLDEVYDKYSKELRFSGIPAKIIIDGKGQIRWSSNGYMGSPSALADEISYIIELLKKEG